VPGPTRVFQRPSTSSTVVNLTNHDLEKSTLSMTSIDSYLRRSKLILNISNNDFLLVHPGSGDLGRGMDVPWFWEHPDYEAIKSLFSTLMYIFLAISSEIDGGEKAAPLSGRWSPLTPLNCAAIIHLHMSKQITFITRGFAANTAKLDGGGVLVMFQKRWLNSLCLSLNLTVDRHFRCK